MPRETVYSEPGDRFVIDVGWQRDQHMQLGIRTADDRHLVDEFYGDGAPLRNIGVGVARLIFDQGGYIGHAVSGEHPPGDALIGWLLPGDPDVDGREDRVVSRDRAIPADPPQTPPAGGVEVWVTNAELSILGRATLDTVTGSDYGMSSLWWNPDRAAVNRLIRLLRKARDAAFGRDE